MKVKFILWFTVISLLGNLSSCVDNNSDFLKEQFDSEIIIDDARSYFENEFIVENSILNEISEMNVKKTNVKIFIKI